MGRENTKLGRLMPKERRLKYTCKWGVFLWKRKLDDDIIQAYVKTYRNFCWFQLVLTTHKFGEEGLCKCEYVNKNKVEYILRNALVFQINYLNSYTINKYPKYNIKSIIFGKCDTKSNVNCTCMFSLNNISISVWSVLISGRCSSVRTYL